MGRIKYRLKIDVYCVRIYLEKFIGFFGLGLILMFFKWLSLIVVFLILFKIRDE